MIWNNSLPSAGLQKLHVEMNIHIEGELQICLWRCEYLARAVHVDTRDLVSPGDFVDFKL